MLGGHPIYVHSMFAELNILYNIIVITLVHCVSVYLVLENEVHRNTHRNHIACLEFTVREKRLHMEATCKLISLKAVTANSTTNSFNHDPACLTEGTLYTRHRICIYSQSNSLT